MASEYRRDCLSAELKKMTLKIRPDSRLCRSFVDGELGHDWPVRRVAQQCALMHWLYNFTPYPAMLRDAMRYHSQFIANPRDLHLFVRDHVEPLIKNNIFSVHGGAPSEWPWVRAASHG